jgi:shikimate dehydrogenase
MTDIVLIGMPGSGKSTLGREAAKELGMEFLDTDVLIEQHERRPITEIFKTDGEPYFRRVETQVIRTVRDVAAVSGPKMRRTGGEGRGAGNGLMLSVGGGAAENPVNIGLLREIGTIIFIDRPLAALERNVAFNAGRPLLSGRDKLVELYTRRTPLYADIADRTISNGGGREEAIEELIRVALLRGAGADFLVIGDPIAHTRSPQLHAAAFEELKRQGYGDVLDGATYGSVRVPADELGRAMEDVRAGSVRGLNVTIPHKKAVIGYLDDVAGDAAAAGAVNTVVKRDGRLMGYNTDMEGLKLALADCGRTYGGATVTVCGTGGAAAGIVCKAALEGAARIYILGRNADKAAAIAEKARAAAPSPPGIIYAPCDFGSAETLEIKEAIHRTDIFINATPLGMSGTGKSSVLPSFADMLPEDAFVYDLVYEPAETELLKAARRRGLAACGGLSMLIRQGILSDELFFGIEPDRSALYEAVRGSMVL